MRLDHIAYRVPNRDETVEHLTKMFGYHVEEEFTIDFDNGSKAECKALIALTDIVRFKTPCSHVLSSR